MIRSSNYRSRLIAALAALIPEAQTETHAVDQAAAESLHINRTDLHILGIVCEQGLTSASKLAEAVRLTRASMTTALDRLEQVGLIRRVSDRYDRRGVNVEVTRPGLSAVRKIWNPIRTDGLKLLETYSNQDLALLDRFFRQYCDLQRKHARRIRET
jgi:DNA-binding MarR family transcriptional regulator